MKRPKEGRHHALYRLEVRIRLAACLGCYSSSRVRRDRQPGATTDKIRNRTLAVFGGMNSTSAVTAACFGKDAEPEACTLLERAPAGSGDKTLELCWHHQRRLPGRGSRCDPAARGVPEHSNCPAQVCSQVGVRERAAPRRESHNSGMQVLPLTVAQRQWRPCLGNLRRTFFRLRF